MSPPIPVGVPIPVGALIPIGAVIPIGAPMPIGALIAIAAPVPTGAAIPIGLIAGDAPIPVGATGITAHMGIAGFVQSALVTHPTQVNVAGSQRGVVPVQLLSAWHCAQRMVAESQTGATMGQSVDERQPTHAPVMLSQILGWPIPIGQAAPPSPQAEWQV